MKKREKKLREGEKKNLEPTHFFSKLTIPLLFSLVFGPFILPISAQFDQSHTSIKMKREKK